MLKRYSICICLSHQTILFALLRISIVISIVILICEYRDYYHYRLAASLIATALLIARFKIGAGVSGASVSGEYSAVWIGVIRGAEDEGCEGSRTVFCQ